MKTKSKVQLTKELLQGSMGGYVLSEDTVTKGDRDREAHYPHAAQTALLGCTGFMASLPR